MSKMKELYERVSADITLQAKFSKIMEKAEESGEDTTSKKLVEFAKESGYDVTVEDIKEFFKDMSETKNGELSESELDMVAGGKSKQGDQDILLSIYTFATNNFVNNL